MRPYWKSVCQLSLLVMFGMVLGYLICDDLWQFTAAEMIRNERAVAVSCGIGEYTLNRETGEHEFRYAKLAQGTPMYVAMGDVVGWDGPAQQLTEEELRRRLQALQDNRYKLHNAKYDKLPQLPDMH